MVVSFMDQKTIDILGETIYCTYCKLPVKYYDQGPPLAMMNKIEDLARNGSSQNEILAYFKNLYGPIAVNDGINFYAERFAYGFYDTYTLITFAILLIIFTYFQFRKIEKNREKLS